MTIKTATGRYKLNNVEELTAKRGVTVRMVYDNAKHSYAVGDRLKYKPYTRGRKDR